MATAKLFEHGGDQAVHLPKEFRFDGVEVSIEKRGEEVVLKPIRIPKFKTLDEVAQYMRENHPYGADFPDIERPGPEENRAIDLD